VLANRLTACGRHRTLVLEAGGEDRSVSLHIPLGYGRHFTNPAVNWLYTTEPEPDCGNRCIIAPRGDFGRVELDQRPEHDAQRPPLLDCPRVSQTGAPSLESRAHSQSARHACPVRRGRAVGVEYRVGAERRRARAAREVILAGGAFAEKGADMVLADARG
jgi:choline dehydrogenase-like flavoprotein